MKEKVDGTALLGFALNWELDGDWLTCKWCQNSIVAERFGEKFAHKGVCKNLDSYPWKQLSDLLAPIQTGERQRLREALRVKSDRAYCDYIDQLKKPECLGWEAKVKSGTFGEDELVGHCIAQELLGKHKAFAEALTLLGASPELS